MIHLSPNLIVPAIIFLLILMWVLNRWLYRPVLKVLDDRQAIVAGAAQDTADAEGKINALSEEYDTALQESRRIAKTTGNQAQAEALAAEKEILTEAHHRAEAFLDKAMVALDKSADAAREELRGHAETLSREVSARILGRAL